MLWRPPAAAYMQWPGVLACGGSRRPTASVLPPRYPPQQRGRTLHRASARGGHYAAGLDLRRGAAAVGVQQTVSWPDLQSTKRSARLVRSHPPQRSAPTIVRVVVDAGGSI